MSFSCLRMRMPVAAAIMFYAAVIAGFSTPVRAEFPERPVSIIVPYQPGGTSDVATRILAEKMAEILGQQVVIENVPGAATQIGLERLARAEPDGYSIGLGVVGMLLLPHTSKTFTLEVLEAFAPIGLFGSGALIVTTNPETGVKSLGEFIEYAKANPGKLASGSSGLSDKLTAEWMNSLAGIDVLSVLYQGGNPAVTALVSNEVQLVMLPITTIKPLADSGQLVPLAITSPDRATLMPDIPTVDEAGLPGFHSGFWLGLMAPTGTPDDVVVKLNDAMVRALEYDDLKEKFVAIGLEREGTSPSEFRQQIIDEAALWKDLADKAGVVPE